MKRTWHIISGQQIVDWMSWIIKIEIYQKIRRNFRKIILASSIGYEKIGCLYQEKEIYKEKQVEKKRHEMKWEMDRIGEG